MTDRAVSEVIAFILVFSIVITSVGLLYSVGFGSLNQIQATEQDRSAEQAMRAVAVGFDDVQRDRGSVRQVGVDLAGRSMFVDDGEQITVEVGGETAEASGALVYGAGEDTEIAYAFGAVLRSQGEDAQVVSREPRFRCGENHAVISLVEVVDDRNGSVSSSDTIRIVGEQRNPDASRRVLQDDGPSDVTIEYSGKYDQAWERYFDEQGWANPSDNTYTCPNSGSVSDGVYVRKTVLEIDYLNV